MEAKNTDRYEECIRAGICPECGAELVFEGGCCSCPACGWSACGN